MKMLIQSVILLSLLVAGSAAENERTKRQSDDRVIRVTTIETEPFLKVNGDKYEGFIPDLMDQLAKEAGLKYEFQLVKDGLYGSRGRDGTWNGMIGELAERQADLAAAPITITSQRERVVDFTKPFMSVGITSLIQKPSTPASDAAFWLLQPFAFEVWFIIGCVFLVSAVVFYLVRTFVPAGEDSEGCCKWTTGLFGSVLKLFGVSEKQPVAVSVLLVTWRTTFIFTAALYLSTLVALTTSKLSADLFFPLPFSNIKDLSSQTSIKYGYVRGGSTETFFQVSKIAVYERIYGEVSSSEPPVTVSSVQEGIERARRGNYALLGESAMLEYFAHNTPRCDLMTVGGLLNSVGYGLATPIGSDLREVVNLVLLGMKETGFLQKLYDKWWRKNAECTETSYSSPGEDAETARGTRVVTLKEFVSYGSIYLFVVGIILTIIVAVCEVILRRNKNKSTAEATPKAETV